MFPPVNRSEPALPDPTAPCRPESPGRNQPPADAGPVSYGCATDGDEVEMHRRLTAWLARAMLAAVSGTGEHVPRNRAAWDRWAAEYAAPGLRNWAAAQPSWGIWGI